MNINELDSFNLADAVKFNEELNPRIWQGSRMRPEVRKKLLAIARDFKQSLGLSDLEVKDITLSGSNAGYTYTPHSDIDLHLVVDMPQAETDEVYRELFNAKKYQYNDEHNLSIGGYPVELYVQPVNQPHHSQGIYSVLNNDWTAIPRKRKSTVNDGAVKSKYELMKHRIESTIDSGDIKRLTRTAARIKQIRQAGLDKNGELGPENLAYKMLRTQGLIEKLYTARTAAKDQLLSLQERKKKKKSRVRYGFGGYYTPGFAFGGDSGEGGGDGGGGESMREDATISPYGVSPTTQMFLNETGDSEQTVHDFISHAAERLGIENMPTIELHTDPAWSEREHSFGRYTPNTHTLEVNLANRHIMDILRTVAHELVHCRQHELSPLPDEAGETGSRWENEAHAKAGELMRDYADANPNRFGEHALAEASGYIPTKAQARDPRFSTALTVDVHPGQTGKEANKMALQTDAQGRPALLMKGLANQLHEEFAQFDEGVALFEIKMTGKNLRAEAAKTGAIAGMEFEMIVPNVEGGDEDAEPEPDWDYDESVGGISDAVDFFDDAGQNSRRDLERLRERMQENYHQWLSDQFQSQWERDDSEFVFNYIKENASPEEIAEILDIELDGDSYPDTIDRQALLDATEKIVADGYSNRWYNDAYETAQEEFNNDADQESEWLEDQEINTMQDVMNTFGVVDWPHWNTPGGGDRSIEDVANDFQDAIGIDVQASTNYHAGSVDRPSTSSHHYVVEPDGSLEGDDYGDRGLEFVSPPLPIDVILNDLNKVKRWADSYGCYTNDSTGLHINISVPDYSRDKLDFVKLAILMGDEYVSDSFGRLGAFYAKSAMGMIRDNVRSRPEAVADALEKMRTHMNTAASKAIHAGVTAKFTSINVKDGHIEFRSPGGDWLGENFDKIENTLLRFTVAMSAALNPEMYREEYLKKLYKILNPDGQKDEYGDMIQEFSKYMASLQGGEKEASGKLSKETQQAIKDFRTAASKELKQKNLANKLKKGDTAGQKYWWKVSNPGNSNAGIEVVATTKQEAIEKAISDDGYPSWASNLNSLVAKPLSPYYEKSKPSVWKVYGSNSSPYQRLGTEVVATDEFEAMQKARQKWNLNVGGRTEEEFFSTNGWSAERIGDAPAEQTTKYEIYNKQTGNSVEPADGITNDADALVRLNDYIEHGPHSLQRGQASRMFGIRTTSGVEIVDIDIPMAQGRAQTSPTGQWKIIDGLGRELFRFRPAFSNTRAVANELAALWARENNFDGNYQVEPAEDTAPALTPDQRQGGLIDVAGSTNDLARQRATPGTFTGTWRVLDADGNELYRFSGVGNVQSDANRVAVQWMRSNGYDQRTNISVVHAMSESIAEGADKKYTIKKSYTMSKAGVEKSVWHIMDGDFVVDVTDLRRDAKYYADKWNAAEKESSNASQNLHKQDVTEGLLKEFAPGEGGFGPFKVYISNEFIEEFPTFDQAKEEIDFLRTADPKSFDADWKIIDGTGKTVWQHDPGEAIDAMRMRRKIQFNKPDNNGVAEGKDFDRCFDQACKLYDQAVNKNLKPKLVQVADFQGDGNGADARWMKLPQHVWQHYVVIVGDQVLDPTAKQFGDSMPTQYQVSDLDRLWGKQYQIRPRQGVAEGAEEINWIKPNFDYEWDEIEFQSKQPQVPADVRNYMAKHFPDKQAWMKSVQYGRPVVMRPDHGQKIRNYTDNKRDLLNALSPASHDPQGPAKAKRVNALFDKGGPIEMPIILQTEKGLWLIGGKTRLGTANLLKGIPAKVWIIGGKQGVAEGKLVESAVFLNPNTVVVGQAHGQPLELSPDTLKKIQAIAAKHGAWYEGNGTDRGYTKGQIDRYVGSWDDEVAKTASPNDPEWLYVLFANVDANNRVQRVGINPKDTIFNRLLATAKDNSFQGIGYTPQALQKFLQMASEGQYDFVKMSQQPATQENLTRFLKAGEALMWPSNWEQYPNKAGKIAKAATVDVRDQYLATREAGVYVTGSGHLKAVQNITGKQGVAEGLEFFSMPLRMSEYRGKHHPATNEPYDAKFKFSGDLKDRIHSLLDAGTKPTLLQVNPRHLLATQDWLSTQGGGKPPFATMKQHPVVLQKNNKLYILDGHHRSADALKAGAPIEVYLFRDEL